MLRVTTKSSPEAAETQIRDSLANAGFGVLTEIDMSGTLASKLGVEVGYLKILGACNPKFAYEALQADRNVALLLPCNVVIDSDANGTAISVPDPGDLLPGNEDFTGPVKELLRGALSAIGEVQES